MYSMPLFINIEYYTVLYPPDQLDMKPFVSSFHPSNFIGWGYIAVPGRRLQAVLVVLEGFVPAPFFTFTLAHLFIIIFKNLLN